MKIMIPLLLLCLIPFQAHAEQTGVYRCLQNGKTLISTEPCPSGASSIKIEPDATPETSAASKEEELLRLRQQADAMEKSRLQREALEAARRKEQREKAEQEERAKAVPTTTERDTVFVPVAVPRKKPRPWPPTDYPYNANHGKPSAHPEKPREEEGRLIPRAPQTAPAR